MVVLWSISEEIVRLACLLAYCWRRFLALFVFAACETIELPMKLNATNAVDCDLIEIYSNQKVICHMIDNLKLIKKVICHMMGISKRHFRIILHNLTHYHTYVLMKKSTRYSVTVCNQSR